MATISNIGSGSNIVCYYLKLLLLLLPLLLTGCYNYIIHYSKTIVNIKTVLCFLVFILMFITTYEYEVYTKCILRINRVSKEAQFFSFFFLIRQKNI